MVMHQKWWMPALIQISGKIGGGGTVLLVERKSDGLRWEKTNLSCLSSKFRLISSGDRSFD